MHRIRVYLASGLCAALLLLSGCSFLRPATVPLAADWDRASCSAKADTLLVFLPGAYSTIDEFVREGFVQEVRQRRLAVILLMADVLMAYLHNRTIITGRARRSSAPARASGYRSSGLQHFGG